MFGNELLDFIADRFGKEAACIVQENFGGIGIYIPKRKPVDTAQQLIEQHWGKMDTRQLSRLTGLTVRTIQKRLNKPMSNPSREQKTLF